MFWVGRVRRVRLPFREIAASRFALLAMTVAVRVYGGEPPRGAEPVPAIVLGGRVRLFRFPVRDVNHRGESCCFSVVKAIDKLRVKVYNYPTAERRPK